MRPISGAAHTLTAGGTGRLHRSPSVSVQSAISVIVHTHTTHTRTEPQHDHTHTLTHTHTHTQQMKLRVSGSDVVMYSRKSKSNCACMSVYVRECLCESVRTVSVAEAAQTYGVVCLEKDVHARQGSESTYTQTSQK